MTQTPPPRRNLSAAAAVATGTAVTPEKAARRYANPRKELEKAIFDLQKDAAAYVNLSRIQLALRNLGQDPGEESIRIAIVGIPAPHGRGPGAAQAAKKLVKVLVADPLSLPAEWEREIDSTHDLKKPLVIRIARKEATERKLGEVEFRKPEQQQSLLHEVHVDSPEFNGNGIELLVMEGTDGLQNASAEDLEERVLVPMVDIQSSEISPSPATTPVHKTILVGDSVLGAASIGSLPLRSEFLLGAANMPGYQPDERSRSSAPFAIVDLPLAERAIEVFRASINNAMDYEKLWFASGVAYVSKWLKKGALNTGDGSTKAPVMALISSIISNAESAIQLETVRRRCACKSRRHSSMDIRLEKALGDWAERAHRELQGSLDVAFNSRRWRNLGWWRLLWRVDDVGIITNEVLGGHFLVNAERDVVYLAGRIHEAGILEGLAAQEKGYVAPRPFSGEEGEEQEKQAEQAEQAVVNTSPREAAAIARMTGDSKSPAPLPATQNSPVVTYVAYPSNISHTRKYLLIRTVPALQALAQNLVLRTASTVSATSALGVLMFLSGDFSGQAAVAVALLGGAWSLHMMQGKWEAARRFWCREVREEGRKAVRSVEGAVEDVLARGLREKRRERKLSGGDDEELEWARRAVLRAREVLGQVR